MTTRSNPVQHLLAIAVAAALQPATVWGDASSTIPTYQAGAGALSYTFFNLSGNECKLTAYGSGANPNASSSWAQSNGWGNNSSGDAGFFNPNGVGPATGPVTATPAQVTNSYIFYDNSDPINTSSVPGSAITLNNGSGQVSSSSGVVITSSQLGPGNGNESINYPAIGDSWGISCYGNNTIAVANLASAASALQSNGPTGYPYSISQSGWFYNAAINPPADAGCASSTNPCGVGFTTASNSPGNQVLNWNVATTAANYQAMGGLWSGVNYNSSSSSSSYPAANLLNLPMLPINFSAYVQATKGNFNPNSSSEYMYYTDVYGGHYTLAVGDPFVISSYAAKMLWYTVMNVPLSDDTNLSAIASQLSSSSGGVFSSGSYEDNYVQWLLGSQSSSQNYPGAPQLAANAFNAAFTAASVPVTKESFWGKFFTGLADAALDTAVAALTFVPGGDVVVAASVGAATAADGAITPDMNAAIGNSLTSTISASPPLSQNAPAVINPTYAADNLLGLLLTNTGVQAQINATVKLPTGYSPPPPLWSNYSVYTDNASSSTTGCTNLSVSNNLMGGNCYPSGGGTAFTNSNTDNVPSGTYTNVYATSQTTTEFSLWDAILTGSDVTTDSNGYIVMGNSSGSIASFSPPVQLWNATNGSSAPTTALPSGLAVNTTFDLNSGTLTAQSFAFSAVPDDPTTAGTTPAPAAMPNVTVVVNETNTYPLSYYSAGSSYAPAYVPYYDSATGVYSASYYYVTDASNPGGGGYMGFVNGTQTINMTACPPNSGITLTITPVSNSETGAYASGILNCTILPSPLATVSLSYQLCVSDPWATGGVVAAVTAAPTTTGQSGAVTLACACVPSYLDGPAASQASASQLLGGVVVGATSANNNQTCPTPAN